MPQQLEKKRIVIIAFPRSQLLDLIGPFEIFTSAANIPQSPGYTPVPGYMVEVVSGSGAPWISGELGLSVVPNGNYRDLQGDIDTLLIAGGFGVWDAANDQDLLAWLRTISRQVRRIGSICTGAFVLAAAGLLDGKRATTHWFWCDLLAKTYPGISVESDPIFLRDGKVYTCAGITAGMDLALALVEEDFGPERSLKLAQAFVLFLRRSGGQSQFSALLSAQAATRDSFAELQHWMAEHIAEPLPVSVLAARLNLSPRQFARVFVAEFAMTPGRFVEKLRIETAQRLLRETGYPPKKIAALSGFAGVEVMRRCFLRNLGISAIAYRNRFS